MTITMNKVANWMVMELTLEADSGKQADIIEPDGRPNLTRLAEEAAWHFDHDEWLDDELHFVWEAAIDAADRFIEAT